MNHYKIVGLAPATKTLCQQWVFEYAESGKTQEAIQNLKRKHRGLCVIGIYIMK